MGLIVPYGIQSYTRADLPQVRLVNMYAEAVPDSPAASRAGSRRLYFALDSTMWDGLDWRSWIYASAEKTC